MPGTIASDSPWRTRSSSVEPGGRRKRVWRYSVSAFPASGRGRSGRSSLGARADSRHAGPSCPAHRRRMTDDLLDAARAVQANAHVPYSHFPVGAAVRSASGRVFVGCNVENASFPEGICAEAAAIGAMVAAGEREIVEVLTVADGERPDHALRRLPPADPRVRRRRHARPRRRPRGRAPDVHPR